MTFFTRMIKHLRVIYAKNIETAEQEILLQVL